MTRKTFRGDEAEQARVDQHLAANRDEGLSLFHQTTVRAHTRTVKGPEPKSGHERKDAVLEKMEGENAMVLLWLRAELATRYARRTVDFAPWIADGSYIAYVTADDVYSLLHDSPAWSCKLDGPQQWRASVWRRGFVKIKGLHVPSLRPNQHAALIQAWRPME